MKLTPRLPEEFCVPSHAPNPIGKAGMARPAPIVGHLCRLCGTDPAS